MTPLQLYVLRQFRQLGIRHLVVGGQAMRAYGIDRATRDLDLWVARDATNAKAMTQFLHRVQSLSPLERLQKPNFKFTVGDPAKPDVDILTSVAGDPSFDEMFQRKLNLKLDGETLDAVAPADLLTIKEAAAAAQEADAANGTLNDQDLRAAIGTAQKERKDIVFLRMWIGP